MADPAITVPLPPSVDQFILQICTEQSHPPPDTVARRRLASIGEEASLQLLRNISSWSIQNISQTIMNMTSPPPHSSPQRKACTLSSQKPQQQQQQHSPAPTAHSCLSPQKSPVTVRWYGNSQGSPSSSSENPTRQAINLQLGCPSSISDNPVGEAFSPSPVAHSCMSPHKSPVTIRWYGNSQGSPSSSSELGLPSSRSENLNKREFSPQELALGELEFRKAFLILSYTAKNRLEDLISADEIRGLKHLAMSNFELRVWQAFGYKCIKQEDRQLSIDWESGKTFLYHCFVSEDGSYTFKGPFINKEKNHLQRVLGDDNVLNVKFAGATDRNYSVVNSYVNKSRFSRIFRDGILVGPRCFRFLVFKDGGKEAKKEDSTASPVKCYFVRMESHASMNSDSSYILSNKTAYEARCLFMHVHTVATVAKYMARFSLILSKTIKLEVDIASLHIEMIDDIPCRDEDGSKVFIEDGKLCIHTDGTGFISEDLAVMCPRNIFKGKHNNTLSEFLCNAGVGETTSELQQPQSQILEPPLLIQCRMFNDGCAVKGTLLVNRKLPPKTIQYRPSMRKVITDPKLSDIPTVNSLEIVGTSNQPRKTLLSRNLIALLRYGGVPEQYFMDILLNALKEAQSIHNDKRAAFRASLNHGRMDDFIVASMISSGIPLDEPFLQYHLSILLKEERKSLQGGKLPISDSFYLMGTADPTGKLKSDEVCIILDNGQISGIREKVLVYRNPGLHFGDIHILKATYVKEMEDFVGNAKYAIFFPTQGCRSLADEMAGGDFDGDMFFVSRNIQLLDSFNPSDPWTPTNSKEHVLDKKIIGPSRHADSKEPVCDRKPTDFSAEDLEHELFQLFLTTRFQPSKAAGMAANSWLACMDRLLILGDEDAEEKEILKKKLLLLIDIYYDALDAPKSGMKIEVPKRLIPEKYPHYMENSMSKAYNSSSILGKIFDRVGSYQKENQVVQEISLLPCFEDAEIPEACFKLWKEHYENYLREMTDALKHPDEIKNESADAVIKKYKQILYGAPEFEQTQRNIEEIFDEALAIYKICYDYAWIKEDVGKCQFAWKVAGKALCMIYVRKQGDKSIPCSFSFLRDIFC